MSKTLSKILVICAMVIIAPLMIVGTAFASFYSIEATVNFFAYTGEVENLDAFAEVKHGESADSELSISKGHKQEISVSTHSTGYDFLGWFEGTIEEYKNGTAALISNESLLKIKVEDYSNVVAAFKIKSYTIESWSYLETPEAAVKTTAPAGAKTEYVYGP